MENFETRQISNKSNIKWIVLGFLIFGTSIAALLILGYNSTIIKYILYVLGSFGLLSGIRGLSNYFIVKKENDYLKAPKYAFDYDRELTTYNYIGRTIKKNKIKNDAKCFGKYSEWKNEIEKKPCISNSDFYRYLNGKLRRVIRYIDMIKTVLVPIELGIIAVFCTGEELGDGFNFLGCIVTSIILIIMVETELERKEDEKDFLTDLCEIVKEKVEQ